MDFAVINRLLSSPPQRSIGVAGDFCTDVYWDLEPKAGEVSLETGLLTTPVTAARYSPGGAGNIITNLRGLGVNHIPCFGAVGADPFGFWLYHELTAGTPEYSGYLLPIARETYHTPVYCKPLLNGVEQSRIDLGNTPLTEDETGKLLDGLAEMLPDLKVLIVNEQIANGIHSTSFRAAFAGLVRKYCGRVRFVFDGRDHLDAYPGVTLKINASAASRLACGKEGVPPEESGRIILERSGQELVITDGERGCFVFEHRQTTFIPAIRWDGPTDTVGAGDSFTAGFSYALAAGATLVNAAEFGTCCSAVTIRKLNQTGFPTPEEITALF